MFAKHYFISSFVRSFVLRNSELFAPFSPHERAEERESSSRTRARGAPALLEGGGRHAREVRELRVGVRRRRLGLEAVRELVQHLR